MAGRPRYPLEPLRALRAGEHRARTLDLATALSAEQLAAAALAAAERRRDRAASLLAAGRRALDERMARGVRASELATAQAHESKLRMQLAAEAAAVTRAREGLARAQQDSAHARGEVKVARAREEVVERHRGRWEEEGRRKRERSED